MKDKDTQLLEEAYNQVSEGKVSTVGHVALDLAGLGFDFFGGQGGWFDAANAVWYAAEKNYLYAALSLISVIPVIGDIVGKGGKYLHKVEKMRKTGATMYKAGKVMKGAKTINKIKKVKVALKNPIVKDKIEKIFSVAQQNKKLNEHIPQMRSALEEFSEQETMV